MKVYLTYALNQEGQLVHVDDVPNGKECGCICPACKKPLQAKNAGEVREHHFAHQPGVDCPTALETALHFLAKDKIQRALKCRGSSGGDRAEDPGTGGRSGGTASGAYFRLPV